MGGATMTGTTGRLDALRAQVVRQYPDLAGRDDILALLDQVPRTLYADRYAVLGETAFKSFDGSARHMDEVLSDAPLVLSYDAVGLPASTISAPSIVLKFIALLDPQPGEQIVEVGSGCGWMAAMIARRVGPDGHVTGIEILPEVARAASARAARIGPANLTLLAGDFNDALPGLPPQDRIVATAAFDRVPLAMLRALKPDGVLLLPVTIAHAVNAALLMDRTGHVIAQLPSLFVPATGAFGVSALLPDWSAATGLAHPGTRSAELSARFDRLGDRAFGLRSFVAATEPQGFLSRRPDPKTGKSAPGWAFGTTYSQGALTITDRDGVFVHGSPDRATEELDRLVARWVAVLRPAPTDLHIRPGPPTADGNALSLVATADAA
ncbi:protein-L-isoaspartate O-methyltransferase family protein [Actibacterium ureilyticum]|uniref:protein-L-isoaspartate O-methyltransferase family protein n=1 Tax=Actibacterium ureilyticum TaxID=1590614 RepID=UPI000BAAE604|nr:methyltransferase domain-containing protein [Actibacterium ureilyticum]